MLTTVAGIWCALIRGLAGQQFRAWLAAIAVVGLAVAWWCYPVENRFSIMRCTISFLGSPDANRNPQGWRIYQAGMTALVLLLISLAAERHGKLSRQVGSAAVWSSTAIFVSLTLILLATWIPDSREGYCFGVRCGVVHTRMAILAIPFMVCGIALDAAALWWSGVPVLALWPYYTYGLIVSMGVTQVLRWKRMCRQNPALSEWPGEGLHSTPLWEWIAFTCLVAFMVWAARGTWAERKPDRIERRTAQMASTRHSD